MKSACRPRMVVRAIFVRTVSKESAYRRLTLVVAETFRENGRVQSGDRLDGERVLTVERRFVCIALRIAVLQRHVSG